MSGAAVTVPSTDRHGGLISVPTSTLMENTPTLRLILMKTLYGNTGKTRGCLGNQYS